MRGKRAALIAIAVAVVATACSPSGEGPDETAATIPPPTTTSTTSPPDAPGAGGTARIGILDAPQTLNPIDQGGTQPSSVLVRQATLAGAYVYDPVTWRQIPVLVERIPSLDSGDVTLDQGMVTATWTIRQEAVWSDGVPVSGDDFAFTLEAALGRTECGGIGSLFGMEIDDVGQKSITVSLPGATLNYETLFRFVLPSHATDGTTVCTDDGSTWPSSGPFVVDSFDESGVSLSRNPRYWMTDRDTGTALPLLDTVEFVAYADVDSLRAALEAGDVDVAETGDLAIAKVAELAGADLTVEPGTRFEHLAFQFGSANPTTDSLNRYPEFREAIIRAIDRGALAEATGWPAVDGIVRGAGSPWARYDQDRDEALRLLDELCLSLDRDCDAEPPNVEVSSTTAGARPQLVAIIAEMLGDVGIDVTVTTGDPTEFFGNLRAGSWDLAVFALTEEPGIGRASDRLANLFEPDGFDNVYTYGGAGSVVATDRAVYRYRILSGQIDASADRDRIEDLLVEAQQLIAANVVIIPLVAVPQYTVVWTDRVAGVVPNASPSRVTWNIATWLYLGN